MDFVLTELDPGTNRVTMSGRLDAAGAEAIDLRFAAAVGSVARNALVDLTEVSFVASLGLRMFISTARVLQRRGAQMVLFGAQPQVMEVFETIALDQMIPIVGTEAEARARLAA
jgi:anti-anti-sigma factor